MLNPQLEGLDLNNMVWVKMKPTQKPSSKRLVFYNLSYLRKLSPRIRLRREAQVARRHNKYSTIQ